MWRFEAVDGGVWIAAANAVNTANAVKSGFLKLKNTAIAEE